MKATHRTRHRTKAKPRSKVSIRYMIDDVPAAIEFYTTHLGCRT